MQSGHGPAPSQTPPSAIDHLYGPVFISYRHTDGTEAAHRLARRLRASGLTVWLDKYDLLVGNFTLRMREALRAGPSAGVLVATPDVVKSAPIKNEEFPALADLAHHEGILLAVATALTRDGEPDQSATAALYPPLKGPLEEFKLTEYKMYALNDTADDERLCRDMLLDRVRRLRPETEGSWLRVGVGSFNEASAQDRSAGHLDIRLNRGEGKLPAAEGLRDFANAAQRLTDAFVASGARGVEFTGQVHLSLGLALGALLPRARSAGMRFIDVKDEVFEGTGHALGVTSSGQLEVSPVEGRLDDSSRRILVGVALTTGTAPFAIERLAGSTGWASASLIRLAAGVVEPGGADALAAEIALAIRDALVDARASEVHLAYSGPVAMAPLISRHLNSIPVVVYEVIDPMDAELARYVPVLRFLVGGPYTQFSVLEGKG